MTLALASVRRGGRSSAAGAEWKEAAQSSAQNRAARRFMLPGRIGESLARFKGFCRRLDTLFPAPEPPITISSATMLINGIVNPHLLSLLSRVRHTNALVIADAAFPSWPGLETVDLSLIRGIPTVLEVLGAILPNWKCGEVLMAGEFKTHNDAKIRAAFHKACGKVPLRFEPHLDFKQRVPHAIGLIRTGDTTAYGNLILTSV